MLYELIHSCKLCLLFLKNVYVFLSKSHTIPYNHGYCFSYVDCIVLPTWISIILYSPNLLRLKSRPKHTNHLHHGSYQINYFVINKYNDLVQLVAL
jgi:hypothetical protein